MGRLSVRSVQRVVRKMSAKQGINATPRGLRHTAITAALDLTGGDVRAVQRFSRHRDIRVLLRYDDTRMDLGGKIAHLVAGAV
jgi:integrase/recombinase XerC